MSDSVEDFGRHGSKIAKIVETLPRGQGLPHQAAKAWSRKAKGEEAESGSGISSTTTKEATSTPSRNSTGLMSWLKLNKEGPPEHQGVEEICSSFLTCTQNAPTFLCQFFRGSANFRRQFQVRELSGYQFASPTPKSMKEVIFFSVFVLNYSIFSQFYLSNFRKTNYRGGGGTVLVFIRPLYFQNAMVHFFLFFIAINMGLGIFRSVTFNVQCFSIICSCCFYMQKSCWKNSSQIVRSTCQKSRQWT